MVKRSGMQKQEHRTKATNSNKFGRYESKYINNQFKHYDLKTVIKRYCQDGSKHMT